MAAEAELPPCAFVTLPLPLVHHVFSQLPVDARARAACVSRGWCHVLLERSLWTRLNLSPSSGVRVPVTDAVLAGAARKARGQLTALDVSDCEAVSFEALLAVVRANAGALRELCVGSRTDRMRQTLNTQRVESLLLAAPQLVACHSHLLEWISAADARRMLRNEPPYQPLRLRTLRVYFVDGTHEASVREVAADVAAHASLQRVELQRAPLLTLAALDAVVDAALARQLVRLSFWGCDLSPASAPALARLLSSDTLKELTIVQTENLLDGPSATLLCDALRANSTLTSLSIRMYVWHNADAPAALLGALTGHRSLRKLILPNITVAEAVRPAAGAALGALVAANAPALTELDVSNSALGDAGLRPLFDALPANTHLRVLDISFIYLSAAFARDVLLPAVRADTSLRKLRAQCVFNPEHAPFMREAENVVAERAAGDA
jgi:hypothetical protein